MLLLIVAGPLYAGYHFTATCQQAHQAIVNLQFDRASHLLNVEKQRDPENLIPLYLENYRDFIAVFIREERPLFDSCKQLKTKRINALLQGDKKSPYYRFCLAQVHLQWAFVRVKFQEYFSAALEVNKAYRLLEENRQLHPDFLPNYNGLGLLHTLIGTIPDSYRWVAGLLALEGTVNQGRQELYSVLSAVSDDTMYTWLQPEVLFLLTFIENNLQADRAQRLQILAQYQKQQKRVMKSPLLIFGQAAIYMRTGQNQAALELLQQRPRGGEYAEFSYLSLLEGQAALRKRVPAAPALSQYVHDFKGQNYLKYAMQLMAWEALLEGHSDRYFELMNRLQAMGRTLVDEDKLAQQEATSGQVPHVGLLSARLFFDGGYYSRADAVLDSIQRNFAALEPSEQLEWRYRKARICHASGRLPEAEAFYRQVVDQGKSDKRYYAGNAALKLGEIYELKKQFESARVYYKTCLALRFDQYQDGIHAKAKAGLSRIK